MRVAARIDKNQPEIVAALMKKCFSCKEEKLLTEFYVDKSKKDGVKCYCKVCYAASMKLWKKKNEVKLNAQKALYREKNREKLRESAALSRHSLRISLLKRMGGKCCKCGFDDERAIQFDHMHGDGAQERKNGFDWWKFLKLLSNMSDDLLFSRFQLLCANCNQIKKIENSEYGNGHKSRRAICE